MSAEASEGFHGHLGRWCGEHRSSGESAWCYTCSAHCTETSPCQGCELPMYRRATSALLHRAEMLLADAVTLAGTQVWQGAVVRWSDQWTEFRATWKLTNDERRGE